MTDTDRAETTMQRVREMAQRAADRGSVLSPHDLLRELDGQPAAAQPEHTDRKGRTPAERVAAIQRGGDPVTDQQRADATALLEDLLTAAAGRGVTIDDFDWTVDLPGGCLDVVRTARRS